MDKEESALPIWRLAMALLAAFSGVALSYHFSLGIEKKLLIGFVRSIVQLLLLGYVLLNLIYSLNSPWIVAFYLLAMISIASIEVANRQKLTYAGQYYDAWLSCFIGGGISGIYASLIVFHPNPWWDPKIFIPTTGMIIGNSVSGPAVALDRLFSDVNDKRHEVEVRLAFGGTGFEALLPATRAAIIAAMTPNLNMLSIVGLVSIPGMMTGQLLGGATPLVAAQYQMAILFLLTTTTVISTYLAIKLATAHALISREHRLTPERLIKKSGPKLGLEAALWVSCKEGVWYIIDILTQRCCCLAYCSPLWVSPNINAQYSSTVAYSTLAQSTVELVSPIHHPHSSNVGINTGTVDSTVATSTSSTFKASYTISKDQPFPACLDNNSSSSSGNCRRPPLLTIRNINIKVGEFDLFNEEGFSFTLHQGQRVAVEGCSGLGKTRLLRALAQLDTSLTGSMTLHTIQQQGQEDVSGITLYGQDTTEISAKVQHNYYAAYAQWRSSVMYIPQVSYFIPYYILYTTLYTILYTVLYIHNCILNIFPNCILGTSTISWNPSRVLTRSAYVQDKKGYP